LIVRPYQPGDIGPVTSLVRTVLASMDLRADYGGLGVDVHAVGIGEASGTWVAEDDAGDVVGVAMAQYSDDGHCQLRRLYVSVDAAGGGVGSALLAHAVEWAAQTGYTCLDVILRPELAAAGPFFLDRGFTRRGDTLVRDL
jgi:GNAT superfamily N-acetyltransferase